MAEPPRTFSERIIVQGGAYRNTIVPVDVHNDEMKVVKDAASKGYITLKVGVNLLTHSNENTKQATDSSIIFKWLLQIIELSVVERAACKFRKTANFKQKRVIF